MKTRALILIALSLVASTAMADDIRLTAGSSYSARVTVVVDAAGKVQIDRTKPIYLGSAVTPEPITPDPPKPTDRSKEIETAAKAVDDADMAKNFMALFSGMAQKSRGADALYTTPQQLNDNISQAFDIFLSGSSKRQEWQSVRKVMTDQWVFVAKTDGGMEDYATLLDDWSAGFGTASGAEGEAFDITVIFKILEILADPNLSRIQKVLTILPLVLQLFI